MKDSVFLFFKRPMKQTNQVLKIERAKIDKYRDKKGNTPQIKRGKIVNKYYIK